MAIEFTYTSVDIWPLQSAVSFGVRGEKDDTILHNLDCGHSVLLKRYREDALLCEQSARKSFPDPEDHIEATGGVTEQWMPSRRDLIRRQLGYI